MSKNVNRIELNKRVSEIVEAQPIVDMHTHLYPPGFGTPLAGMSSTAADPSGLLLWGLDELLTYHYLVAEVYRVVPASALPYDAFWKMTKREQADHIWKHLFVERSPISEACRGVLTVLKNLGIDPGDRKIDLWRKHFESKTPSDQIDICMRAANVESLTMTNPVFDDNERARWLKDPSALRDPRFKAVLRIDPLIRNWPGAARKLTEWGYAASVEVDDATVENARKFLRDWIDRQQAIYLAVSLPPTFRFPAEAGASAADKAGEQILSRVILPVCAERKLPFAMMIGSKMRVNPALGDAGDMVGKSDINSLVELCARFPQNKFFCTMLARENQHELAVAARKFGNLMVFGCWWFTNNPSLIDEITRMRLELLGTQFIPQHSDARVLEQIVYKWDHSKRILADVLTDKYADAAEAGWRFADDEIRRDVRLLLHDNFLDFLKR
jgi:hypothetical protein